MGREPLPTDAIDRTLELVRRSQPSGRAPVPACLPPEGVAFLANARSTRAVLYASMEDMIDRTHQVAQELEDQGVVIDLFGERDADSLVQHMVDTAETLAEGSSDDESDPAIPAFDLGSRLRRR